MDFIRSDNTTQIACFTENIRSKFMWDMYADGYKGYALEYDFSGIPLMFSLLAYLMRQHIRRCCRFFILMSVMTYPITA